MCKRVLVTGEEVVRDLLLPIPRGRSFHRKMSADRILLRSAGPMPTAGTPAQTEKQGAKTEPLGIEHDKLD